MKGISQLNHLCSQSGHKINLIASHLELTITSAKKIILTALFTMVLSTFAGCAFDLVHVKQTPTTFTSSDCPINEMHMTASTKASLGTGYSSTIKEGTNWTCIGRIEEGFVYKSKDQILKVEASNIYEAYIVFSEGQLVGFYLPAEKTYSPISKKIALPLENINE